MELYERLGWSGPGRDMGKTLANSLEFVRSADAAPARPDLIPFNKSDVATTRCSLAMAYYLLGDHPQAENWAREALDRGWEYFFGTWRSELPDPEGRRDPQYWNANLLWAHVFRELVLWGTYLGDWESLRKIAQFPDKSSNMDDADYSRADFAFFLALAATLRGEDASKIQPLLEKAKLSKKKKTALAAAALSCIVQDESDCFREAFNGLLAAHHKAHSNRLFTELVSVEGSILYNMAAHRGLEISVPAQYRDYVVLPRAS